MIRTTEIGQTIKKIKISFGRVESEVEELAGNQDIVK
jgi:hypothetical protein